jgi:hypothetical protein
MCFFVSRKERDSGSLRAGVGLLREREPVIKVSLFHHGHVSDRENSRGSQLLDALAGQPLAHVYAILQRLALQDTGTETTSESVAEGLTGQQIYRAGR